MAAYDGWPLLGETAIQPGESRRLGFVFLSGEETAKMFRDAGKFFLWEGGFIGEAVVVLGPSVDDIAAHILIGHRNGQ